MQLLRLVFLLAAFALAAVHSFGQSTPDPAYEYLRAYMLNNEAERLAAAGNNQLALDKFQQAQVIFDGVAQTSPTYQPEVLRFRRDKLASSLADVQAKILSGASAPATPAAPSPVVAAPSTAPVPASVSPSAFPSPTPPLSYSVAPAPPSGDPLTDAFEGVRRAAAAKTTAIEQQLNDALANVGRYQLGYESAIKLKDEAVKQRDEFYLKSEALKQTAAQQQAKITDLEKAAKNGGASKAELEKARKEFAETNEQLSDAKERLTKAEQSVMAQGQKLTEVTMKLAAVEKERDELKKRAPVPDNMKVLVEENEKLKMQIEDARKQIDGLKSDVVRKDAEIGQLKGQLSTIQGELASLRRENGALESQVADLTLELKKISERASDPSKAKPDETPKLMAENQLLKGIIMRQLRQQGRQQEKKKLVIDEIKKTENASKDLIDQVEQLASARMTLSNDEQKLFTTPQLNEIMGSEGLRGTLMAKGDAQTPATTEPKGKAGTPPPTPAPAPKTDTQTKADAQTKAQKDLDAVIEKGNKLLEEGKLPEAEAAYQDVLRADPKNATGLAGLAWTRVQQGKLEDAEATLKKSIGFDAENSSAHYMLGVTLFRRDRPNEAMAEFEKSLTLNAKNARARHYLGVIASKMSLSDRAEREFKSALAIDPGYGEADFNLAVLYATMDPPKWEDAQKHYDEALKKGVKVDPNLEKLLKAKGKK